MSKFVIENFSDLLINRIRFLRVAREQAEKEAIQELREQRRKDWDNWRNLPADERLWLQKQLKGKIGNK